MQPGGSKRFRGQIPPDPLFPFTTALVQSICMTGDRSSPEKIRSLSSCVFEANSQEVLEDPDFKKTGKTLVKQLINIRLVLEVQEYAADVYYNPKTPVFSRLLVIFLRRMPLDDGMEEVSWSCPSWAFSLVFFPFSSSRAVSTS